MSFNWQDVAAWAIVFAAAAYLVRRSWRQFAKRRPLSGCSSCAGCTVASQPSPRLVALSVDDRRLHN